MLSKTCKKLAWEHFAFLTIPLCMTTSKFHQTHLRDQSFYLIDTISSNKTRVFYFYTLHFTKACNFQRPFHNCQKHKYNSCRQWLLRQKHKRVTRLTQADIRITFVVRDKMRINKTKSKIFLILGLGLGLGFVGFSTVRMSGSILRAERSAGDWAGIVGIQKKQMNNCLKPLKSLKKSGYGG